MRRVAIIKYFDLEKWLAWKLHSNVLQRLILCTVFYPPTIVIVASILLGVAESGNMLPLNLKSFCLNIYLYFKLREGSFPFLRLQFLMFQINLFVF